LNIVPEFQASFHFGTSEVFGIQTITAEAGAPLDYSIADTDSAVGILNGGGQSAEAVHKRHIHTVARLGGTGKWCAGTGRDVTITSRIDNDVGGDRLSA